MNIVEEAIATLGIPGSIAVVIVIIFAVLQLIGEFIEVSGKVAPAALKIRKLIQKALKDKKDKQERVETTLNEVKTLLNDVNKHYSEDNIAKRDAWMQWVNERAVVYDSKVEELIELRSALNDIANALADNTKTTEEMFKESCRDRIISFASKVINPIEPVSREEFDRILRVYDDYELFLQRRNEPNGQVEMSMALIREAYTDRMRNHNFIEDMRANRNS